MGNKDTSKKQGGKPVGVQRLVMRRRSQLFMRDGKVTCSHCIEVKHGGRWQFLGGDNGIHRFATAAERDAKMAEIEESHNKKGQ